MATTLNFDADLAGRVETAYATPDVSATRIAVFRAAAPRTGEIALDLGCGPGYLTRELAMAVGPKGEACARPVSKSRAAKRCRCSR